MGEVNSNNTIGIHKPNLVWEDLQVNIYGRQIGAVPPSDVVYQTVRDATDYFAVSSFSGTTSNSIYFNVQMPHSYYEKSYKRGGYIYPHFHAVYGNATAGNSYWSFSYTLVNVNEIIPNTIVVNKTFATPGIAHKHVIHSFDPIDVSVLMAAPYSQEEKRISCFLMCALTRSGGHVNDTYNSPVYLMGVDFHIQKDMNGSIAHFNKYREI